MAAGRPPVLLGRAGERQAFERLLTNVRDGQSAVLVVRGESGVGKTTLLHYCAWQASGVRVTHIAGVEAEMELPFAALHQLCAVGTHDPIGHLTCREIAPDIAILPASEQQSERQRKGQREPVAV